MQGGRVRPVVNAAGGGVKYSDNYSKGAESFLTYHDIDLACRVAELALLDPDTVDKYAQDLGVSVDCIKVLYDRLWRWLWE